MLVLAERDRFREPFVNPYVDKESDEARLSALVTMDEVQERWRKGSWQPDEEAFRLSSSFFGDDGEPEEKAETSAPVPESNRFAFDLQKDIIHADETFSEPGDVAYTDSYRPRGDIGSGISNIALDRLRYNALAGIQEELPDDLSYLYGESGEKRAARREPVRDRRYNRLDTPVEKRRAKVDQMIPQRQGETPEMIMEEVRKRRDAKKDKEDNVRKPTVKRRSGLYHMYDALGMPEAADDWEQNEYDVERVTGQGSWRSELPEQDGLVPDSRTMPYFGRFSRTWSKIDALEPTRADLLRHTVNTIYDYADDDGEEHKKFRANGREHRGYAVDDADFDPDDRYRKLHRKRRRVAASKNILTESIMSGEFNNPYVQVSDERLKHIINHDMRGPGQSAEPQGLTDPALIHEWNMGYSRVNTDENRYAAWFDEQSELAEHAEQSRYRGSHRTGRPGAYMQREKPYGEGRRYPGGEYNEHEIRRRDVQEQVERAARRGLEDGEEIVRRRQEAERHALEEQRRVQEERLREQQRIAYERQQAFYQKQREQILRQQQEYMKRQQEYIKRQQQSGAGSPQRPMQGQYPQGYPQQPMQGQYPQGYPQQPMQGQYPQGYPQRPMQGQYPQGYPQQPMQGQPPQGYPQRPMQGQYPQGYPQQPMQGQPPQGYPQQPMQGQPSQGRQGGSNG